MQLCKIREIVNILLEFINICMNRYYLSVSYRLLDFQVYVSNSTKYTDGQKCYEHDTTKFVSHKFNCVTSVRAKHVIVRLSSKKEPLSICEFQVFSKCFFYFNCFLLILFFIGFFWGGVLVNNQGLIFHRVRNKSHLFYTLYFRHNISSISTANSRS